MLGVLALLPVFGAWNRGGWGDWQQFEHWWEVGRVALLRHGEFPLFDPHHCGGVPMWGQPQMQYLAPSWWVTGLLFGTIHGHKLFLLLHHVIGFVGMYVVGRRIVRLHPAGAALAAVAWTFSGYFAWRSAGGHATFLGFHYLPLIFYCWRKSDRDLRYAGGVACLLGMQLVEGGTYPFPLTFLVLAFDFVVRLPTGGWRLWRTAFVAGTLSGLVGAIRLWPIYLTMSRFPRATRMEDAMTFWEVVETLTAREPHGWLWGHRWVWAEYGSFVGWTVVVLGAVGAVLAFRRTRSWHLPLGAAVFIACAMGNVGPLWPWPLLHELPVFGNFHVPSRFLVIVAFYVTLLAGLALDRGLSWMNRATAERRTQAIVVGLAWVLVASVGLDVLTNTTRIVNRWRGPPITGEPVEAFHLVTDAPYLPLFMQYPRRNVGTVGCYDPVPWEISDALWVGPAPQARLEPEDAGHVQGTARTNHTFEVEASLDAPARLLFNQNYDPDWRLSSGEPVSDQGLLAVDLPAGEHHVVADYQPPDLPWSVLACVLGLLGCGLLAWRPRRGTPPDVPVAVWPWPRRAWASARRTLGLWHPPLPPEHPAADDRTRRASEQRAAAAERLFGAGQHTLAWELARDAFLGTVRPMTAHARPLAEWGLSRRQVQAVRQLESDLAASPLESHARLRLTEEALSACALLHARWGPATWSRSQRRRQRVARALRATTGLAACAGALLFWMWPRPSATVTTSGRVSVQHIGNNAIDGHNDTEWLLPDREPGWIEVRLDPPRPVERVRLRNAHNSRFDDRATDEYTIQVFAGNEPVLEESGRWETFDAEPSWYEHVVGHGAVDRIRVTIESYHRRGGGLSEIQW